MSSFLNRLGVSMSDAELLELYAIYVDAFAGNLTVVITLIFAYLIATYISAKNLGAFQFYTTTGLFAVATTGVALGGKDLSARSVSLQNEIVRRISMEGSEISYVSVFGMPEHVPPYILGVSIVAVFLAVSFAISQRRRDT